MPSPLNKNLVRRMDSRPASLRGGLLHEHPERIVQFGEGNFLRAFADWMVDVLNEQGVYQGRVVVVQPIRQGMAQTLNDQDGLYTVLLRGLQAGQVTDSRRLVTAISRALNPHEEWAALEDCFSRREIRFVLSNTTEAGIAYHPEAWRPGVCPESFPAKVTALLRRRFEASGGDPSWGLIFLPCELIDRNGDNLRRCVLRHAEDWGLGSAFMDWVERHHRFLNTLVDRIVPGHPRDEAARLAIEFGYEDRLLVTGEAFHLWVIEGPHELAEELPFHKAGLNVVWTDNLEPYRTRKVRILNGAHTASVLATWLAGLETVGEMMADPLFGGYVRRLVFEEVVPTVPLPEEERASYARAVLERFMNPFIRHELLTISLNSVSKWRVRVLPSLLDQVRLRGALPPLLSFSLAALVAFYRGERSAPGEMRGRRGTATYPIRDEPPVLDVFERAWCRWQTDGHWQSLSQGLLGQKALWGADLNEVPHLTARVAEGLEALEKGGTRQCLTRLLETNP